jgi:hypothetical protein
MTTNEQAEHPRRACSDDYRYTQVLVTNGAGTKEKRERMAKQCLACSEYLDCLDDVIDSGKAWEFYEQQAGLTE